jgi:hypothetical protein
VGLDFAPVRHLADHRAGVGFCLLLREVFSLERVSSLLEVGGSGVVKHTPKMRPRRAKRMVRVRVDGATVSCSKAMGGIYIQSHMSKLHVARVRERHEDGATNGANLEREVMTITDAQHKHTMSVSLAA